MGKHGQCFTARSLPVSKVTQPRHNVRMAIQSFVDPRGNLSSVLSFVGCDVVSMGDWLGMLQSN